MYVLLKMDIKTRTVISLHYSHYGWLIEYSNEVLIGLRRNKSEIVDTESNERQCWISLTNQIHQSSFVSTLDRNDSLSNTSIIQHNSPRLLINKQSIAFFASNNYHTLDIPLHHTISLACKSLQSVLPTRFFCKLWLHSTLASPSIAAIADRQ